MNVRTGKINYYIYIWKDGMETGLAEKLRPGDRISVSIRDLGLERNRETFAQLRRQGVELWAFLPVLWKPGQGPSPEEIAPQIDGWYAGNIGQIRRLLDTGKPVYGDAGLNVFNRETAEVFAGLGLSGVTLSYELGKESVKEILEDTSSDYCCHPERSEGSSPISFELLRSGRIPAMVSEYCPFAGAEGIRGDRCGRCRKDNPVWLKDFKGERYPVLLDPAGCTSLILSRRSLDRPVTGIGTASDLDLIERICVFD